MLLIIDNAVHGTISRRVFVLVTSRRNDIFPGEAKQIQLDVLKKIDAHELILKFLYQPPIEEVMTLCSELENNALALRQAIAYIKMQRRNIKSYGINNYIQDLAMDKSLFGIQVNHRLQSNHFSHCL